MRWRRWFRGLAVVVLLAAAGCSVPAEVSPAPARPPSAPPVVVAPAPAPAVRPEPLGPPVLLVYRIGGLPGRLTAALGDLPGVERTSTLVSDRRLLLSATRSADGAVIDRPRNGYALPVDVTAIDPGTYPAMLAPGDRGPFEELRSGEALLSASSARLRRLGPGAAVVFAGGVTLRVTGVVDDGLVRRAEIVVSAADAGRLGMDDARSVLMTYRGSAIGVEEAVEALAGRASTVRVRPLGQAPRWQSPGGLVPQALIKERFGEFAVRPGEGDELGLDPAWVRSNVVTEAVPLLGSVRCHRKMLPALGAALGELERRRLGRLVDPDDFAGCFSARRIATSGGLSRHAWGLAVDLNASTNGYGSAPRQDTRLVEVMERHGFNWGGRWPTPDGMHFEYVGPA